MYTLIIKQDELLIDMILSEKEYLILDTAINHNQGIINLLSNVQEIDGLFSKGLLTVKNELVCIKYEVIKIINLFKKHLEKDDMFCSVVDKINNKLLIFSRLD